MSSRFTTENRLGELIEIETRRLIAESKDLSTIPSFGDFVVVPHRDTSGKKILICGIVSTQAVTSKDQRIPLALGLTQEEIEKEQPQIPLLLRNLFEIVIFGFFEDTGELSDLLPEIPPPMHSFVYPVTDEEISQILQDASFFDKVLFQAGRDVDLDDLVLKVAKKSLESSPAQRDELLISIGKKIAKVFWNDRNRLDLMLRRLERL